MTNQEIRELIELAKDSGVAELEVERAGDRVRIRLAVQAHDIVIPAVQPQAPAAPVAAPPAAPEPDASLMLVKAPIVGTFYESPSPGAAAFVKPGDTVQPGQVLCIIESMKLMNEIEAETAGVVVSRLVENGRPVEYGEALFTVRPL